MGRVLGVIGVGNMAKAVLDGIDNPYSGIDKVVLYDKNQEQYSSLHYSDLVFEIANSETEVVASSDSILLSVKPQNYDEVLDKLIAVEGVENKLYISIAAGITSDYVSERLLGATVVRVLPNVPMLIGMGVSVICRCEKAKTDDFDFVCSLFSSAGSVMVINENEMNRIISVTSSSPAYVFKFIDAIYKGALAQGLNGDGLIEAICDVLIGSATMLKNGNDTPEALISKVASKGGTTERAIKSLENDNFDEMILNAMLACTQRADELGKK